MYGFEMSKIDTKNKLIAYIRLMLGSPQINVEVSDLQMSQIIDDVIQTFTEYAYGELEGTLCVQINGKGEYKVPSNITNIKKLSRGNVANLANFSANYGTNYVPDLWSQQFFTSSNVGTIMGNLIQISNTRASIDKYFGDDIYYNWNPYKKVLQVFDTYKGVALLNFYYEYTPDETDMIYDHEWIKKACIAKTKILWGTITGKYSGSLVGGASINYADMKSEGNSEWDKCMEELRDKWCDPAPIDVC